MMKSLKVVYGILALGGVSVGLLLGAFWQVRSFPRVAVFDLKQVETDFVTEAAHAHLSKEEMLSVSQYFGQQLEPTLNAYAAKQHLIILAKTSVMAGGQDITRQIEQQMADQMRQHALQLRQQADQERQKAEQTLKDFVHRAVVFSQQNRPQAN